MRDAAVPSVLDPRGPAGSALADVSWQLMISGTVAFALTMVLLWWALRRRARHRPGLGFVLGLGLVAPLVVLVALMAVTLRTASTATASPDDAAVVIDVIGHQYWWEVRYEAAGVVTANEIVVPAGEQVVLRLRSADVIHSYWIPQLQGKTDLIPGRENTMWLQADEPGTYQGVCAEFCGLQHARMRTRVIAVEPDEFVQWLEEQAADAAPAVTGAAVEGEAVFMANCAQCHAVRGVAPGPDEQTDPGVVRGPDLTHLASRQTIAAGILPNNRGALGGWILDPQSQKPGARMPPTGLEGPEVQALLDYLEGLE